MRGFLAFLFLSLVALGAGAVGYNIGVSQAVSTAATSAGATVVYTGGWHLGGLLFLPFAFFLVPLLFIAFFGFLAFAFGPRRRYGHGGWSRHDGFGPAGGWDDRRQWIADAHRRLHEEEARRASTSGSQPAPGATPPSDGPSAG